MMIQGSEPFVSSENIEKGTKGLEEILSNLNQSSFGLIIMTSDNVNKPWLYFEAGVISKRFDSGPDTRVSAFMFDLKGSEVKGSNPLMSIFQYTENDKDDIFKLIKSINNSMGERRIDDAALIDLFEMVYPQFTEELNHARKYVISIQEPQIEEQSTESIEPILNELVNQNREMLRHIKSLALEKSNSAVGVKYADFSIAQRAFLKGLYGIRNDIRAGIRPDKYSFHLNSFLRSLEVLDDPDTESLNENEPSSVAENRDTGLPF
ncbi:hypothetical protein GCM10008937_08900 [Deinococcus depolymerans]|uniref:TIR domain-containing protein n=2 Tax=Deinococcus depolymerans TaxID=392408 RepID=A0ABP3LM16_9DEIO